MPFKSEKQRRFLYAKKPEVAERFARHMGHRKFAKAAQRKAKK